MLRFDDFRLDPVALQVFRNGIPLDAPPQVVDVLACLIAHRDRIVTRQELLERFWPRAGTGGDAALNTCVRRIRALLEDDAETPRYIQTRPRAGYRFIGTLADEHDALEPLPAPPRPMPRAVARWPLAGGLLAVALGIGGALWAHAALSPPEHRIAIEPVQGLCEYVLFPKFNAGLRESLTAQISHRLPAGYRVATDSREADLHARVSVRQTPQQTVVVLTLVDRREGRLLWSGEYSGKTDMDDYVPLQRSLAERMAAGLSGALDKRS